MTSVELVNMPDGCANDIQRKQSDLDSGLELDDKNHELNSKLLLLTAENSNLLRKVEELSAENRQLREELQSKSQILATGNLMISTLQLMLKQREASYEQLAEKYESFRQLVGGSDPDSWSLTIIRNFVEKISKDDGDGSDSSDELNRLRCLVGLMEESLCKMESTLKQEAEWKSEAEREIKKLHRTLNSMISVNIDLKNKMDWYEMKTDSLEKHLRKRLRSTEQLKTCLVQLQDRNEELVTKAKKLEKAKKKLNISQSESVIEHCNPDSISMNSSTNSNRETFSRGIPHNIQFIQEEEYKRIKQKLIEEESNSMTLKTELEKINEEHLKITKQNTELENKLKNLSLLRRNFIKLAMKHKHSVEYKNENLSKMKETIYQLKRFLKISGVDFIERTADSKWVLSVALNGGATRQPHPAMNLSIDSEQDFISSNDLSDSLLTEEFDNEEVKFEEVLALAGTDSSESIAEDVETPYNTSTEGRITKVKEEIDLTKHAKFKDS